MRSRFAMSRVGNVKWRVASITAFAAVWTIVADLVGTSVQPTGGPKLLAVMILCAVVAALAVLGYLAGRERPKNGFCGCLGALRATAPRFWGYATVGWIAFCVGVALLSVLEAGRGPAIVRAATVITPEDGIRMTAALLLPGLLGYLSGIEAKCCVPASEGGAKASWAPAPAAEFAAREA